VDLLLTQPNAPLMPSDPMFLIQGIRELPCECAAILDAGQSRVLRPHHVHLTEGAVGVEEPVGVERRILPDADDVARGVNPRGCRYNRTGVIQGSPGASVVQESVLLAAHVCVHADNLVGIVDAGSVRAG